MPVYPRRGHPGPIRPPGGSKGPGRLRALRSAASAAWKPTVAPRARPRPPQGRGPPTSSAARQRKQRVRTKGFMTESERAYQRPTQQKPSAEELSNPLRSVGGKRVVPKRLDMSMAGEPPCHADSNRRAAVRPPCRASEGAGRTGARAAKRARAMADAGRGAALRHRQARRTT